MRWSKARPTHRLEVTLDELRALRRRIDQDEIQSSDRRLLGALVSLQIGQAERRDARMLAKIAATVAASSSTSQPPSDPKAADATTASPASSSASADAKATSNDEAATPAAESDAARDKPEPAPGDDSKPKGHGRNGASAFRAAQHSFYALALGVLGAVCSACQLGKMSRYREKIVIRIVGQPMFRAEQHHHEQARCRNCGRVVRADGAACVHEGVGTERLAQPRQ